MDTDISGILISLRLTVIIEQCEYPSKLATLLLKYGPLYSPFASKIQSSNWLNVHLQYSSDKDKIC